MTAAKTARWLDLVAFLLHRRMPVTREVIFAAVAAYHGDRLGVESESPYRKEESARRTFERDKDELRALGIEVETVDLPAAEGDEPRQGYRLKQRDFYLPYLELTDGPAGPRPYPGLRRVQLTADELDLLDRATKRVAERPEMALALAAGSLRRKLAFDLPLAAKTAERLVGESVSPAARDALATLQEAVAQRAAVRCRYFSIGRDAVEVREVEPYGLFFSWGRWYAVGRARDRDALRVFRLDRLSAVTLLKGESPFRVPADFSIRKWVGRAPWELAEREPETVRVRFAFPESRWVLHQQVGRPVDAELDDGGAILEFDVKDRTPFIRWLLTFGRQAEVQSPGAVASDLRDLRSRVAALYDSGDPPT